MNKVVLCFPGQGAQEVGMGRAFFEASAAARAVWQEADAVLGFALSRVAFEGPAEELTRTDMAQCAIYTTSVAALVALESCGRFDRKAAAAAAGLSLGEYTALWSAGVFDFATGLKLVRRRGVAMQAAADRVPSGMISLVGADPEVAEKVAQAARGEDVLVVANLNAPGQVVLSGHLSACGRVPAVAKELGIRRAIPLTVAGAFHSPLMEPAREALREALAETALQRAAFPVWSNVTARPVQDPAEIRELLSAQVVRPVRWEESMRGLLADGHRSFVEPPPGRVLAGLLKKIDPEATVQALAEGDLA